MAILHMTAIMGTTGIGRVARMPRSASGLIAILVACSLGGIADEAPISPSPARPSWASAIGMGCDHAGTWADFAIAGVVQRMRWIPPGHFIMGSPPQEQERAISGGALPEWVSGETLHTVTLTHGFWLGDSVVTQGFWVAAMGTNPSAHISADAELPVDSVSWTQCALFNATLNTRVPGAQARFPSEAEWEYACRAGIDEPYGGLTLEQVGWFRANAHGVTHPVKQKLANPWGLYDMHGNVFEWCGDVYAAYRLSDVSDPVGPPAGASRVRRGGAYQCLAYDCRSAMRFHGAIEDSQDVSGYRLCLSTQEHGNAP